MPFFMSLGGNKDRGTTNPKLITMRFPNNTMIKSNDWYHKPGNTSSWSRSSNRALLNRIRRKSGLTNNCHAPAPAPAPAPEPNTNNKGVLFQFPQATGSDQHQFPDDKNNFQHSSSTFSVRNSQEGSYGGENPFLISFTDEEINKLTDSINIDNLSLYDTSSNNYKTSNINIPFADISFGHGLSFIGTSPEFFLDFDFSHNSIPYTLQGNIIDYIEYLYTNYQKTPFFKEMITTLDNKHLYNDNNYIFDNGKNTATLFWAYYTSNFSDNRNRKWYAINTNTTNSLDYFNSDLPITSSSFYTAIDLSNLIFSQDVL